MAHHRPSPVQLPPKVTSSVANTLPHESARRRLVPAVVLKRLRPVQSWPTPTWAALWRESGLRLDVRIPISMSSSPASPAMRGIDQPAGLRPPGPAIRRAPWPTPIKRSSWRRPSAIPENASSWPAGLPATRPEDSRRTRARSSSTPSTVRAGQRGNSYDESGEFAKRPRTMAPRYGSIRTTPSRSESARSRTSVTGCRGARRP